ncbi:MAG: hypothetical protein M3O22_00530 [Pseudomonadota bacterium]|nr:hypothetical protein [Pseudomonadota bacterium]
MSGFAGAASDFLDGYENSQRAHGLLDDPNPDSEQKALPATTPQSPAPSSVAPEILPATNPASQ